MIYLEEKDLQSKLSLLFKKNLYDVAIRIASSQHYDIEGLTEIYKQYGDHLYSKVSFYYYIIKLLDDYGNSYFKLYCRNIKHNFPYNKF